MVNGETTKDMGTENLFNTSQVQNQSKLKEEEYDGEWVDG